MTESAKLIVQVRGAPMKCFVSTDVTEREVHVKPRAQHPLWNFGLAVGRPAAGADHPPAGGRRVPGIGGEPRVGRICGSDKKTVLKLLVDAGKVCHDYQDRMLRGLTCQRIEVDARVPRAKNPPPKAGDIYTWTAIDRDTKLLVSWCLGDRTTDTAIDFMQDLVARLANRVQMTSDGHMAYIEAVEQAFGPDIDYAMLLKVFGPGPPGARRRYMGTHVIHVSGSPVLQSISTSFVERNNLTMRMSMRRFTRSTNGFSKKVENHYWMLALHFFHYNFIRTHETLRVTPAMEAGVADHFMELDDLVRMIEEEYERTRPKTRGPYRKQGP